MLLQFSIGATPGSGWNVIGTPLVSGTKFSGTAVDSTGATVSALTVALNTAFSSGPGSAGTDNADTYSTNIKQNYITIEAAANPVFVLSGLGGGTAVVTVYGNRGTVSTGDRITNVTATGQSGSTFTDTLDARGDAGTQADREATGSVTTGASDSITIGMTKTGTAGHVNAIVVDFTPSATASMSPRRSFAPFQTLIVR